LTFGGIQSSGNIAVAYSAVNQVGFATGSVTGTDRIQMYASYSDGSTSNIVDLTVNIQPSCDARYRPLKTLADPS